MSLLVLSAADVDTIASTLSIDELQHTMAQLFARLSLSSSQKEVESGMSLPPRISIRTANHVALFMPARIGPPRSLAAGSNASQTTDLGSTAIKVVSVPTTNNLDGLPGTTLVLDEATGCVKAVVNARKLTALRNAAGSLLSTSLVYSREPTSIVAFGAGQQIDAHLDLHLRHFPTIAKCVIVNRTLNPRAVSLREMMAIRFPNSSIDLLSSDDGDLEKVVRSADIIICATSSTTPLFPSSWVKNGTHVILIGSYRPTMHEVDTPLIQRAVRSVSGPVPLRSNSKSLPILLVDSREACLQEAGELIDAHIQPGQLIEIGDVIDKDDAGNVARESYLTPLAHDSILGGFDGPVSIFKSVGIGLQDVAIADIIVKKALEWEGGIGTVIPNYDS